MSSLNECLIDLSSYRYIHFVCFSFLRPYGVFLPAVGPVQVEIGGEVALLDLVNAIQRLADLIDGPLQLRFYDYNADLVDDPELRKETRFKGSLLGPCREGQFVIIGNAKDVGVTVVGGGLWAHCGVGVRVSPVVLEAGGEVEFLGGEHHCGCTVRAQGKAGRYVPLTQGNDLYVATAGHLMREGEMCKVVCKCGGQINMFKGECVLSYVPREADLFSHDSVVPDVAVVKLVNPEDADIALTSFQHMFINHGSPVHLTLPSQKLPFVPYHKMVLVFLDGDTEPIKGIVSEVLSRRSGPNLIHGKFVVQTDDPSYQLASGTVVCLGNSVLGLVVARRRHRHGSPVVDHLVCNLRHCLDYVCSGSALYYNKTFQLYHPLPPSI